jgi:hypothetical protein
MSPDPKPSQPAAEQLVDRLRDGTRGRWQVITAASLYMLDLDQCTLTRVAGAGCGSAPVASLRRDYRSVPLLGLGRCQLGAPLIALIQLRDDNYPTLRITTEVLEIRRLSAEPPQPVTRGCAHADSEGVRAQLRRENDGRRWLADEFGLYTAAEPAARTGASPPTDHHRISPTSRRSPFVMVGVMTSLCRWALRCLHVGGAHLYDLSAMTGRVGAA